MHEKSIGRPERDPFEILVGVLAAADRYDLILAIIPVAFAVALVGVYVLGASVIQAIVFAGIIGVLAILDACYVHPPTDQGAT